MRGLPDSHEVLATMFIVNIVSMALSGFLTGLKAIITDLRHVHRARVCVPTVSHQWTVVVEIWIKGAVPEAQLRLSRKMEILWALTPRSDSPSREMERI